MIEIHNVTKSYLQYQALKSISLTIQKGEIYGIIGASGAGKSTLLRLINLLEEPDEGDIVVNGQTLTQLSPKQLRQARKSIGMVFQHFNLLANKTVFHNVMVALELAEYPKPQRHQRVEQCLAFVGLTSYSTRYPAELSGGQKQRVAIARALANNPHVLLCDEPTSSLDANTTAEILGVLQSIQRQLGVTIVIVSHEMDVIKSICNRVSVMADGEIYETVVIEPTGTQRIDHSPQTFVDRLMSKGGTDHA